MKTINLPPYAPTLMESTRAIGYSLEAAVADIIDNSLTAQAKRIDIGFFPIGDSYISIIDDGISMTEEELIAAMQYGSKNPNDIRDDSDLGRYGLGLKTASLSQCRKLTVVSVKNGRVSGCSWDLDHIRQAKDWSLLILGIEDIIKLPDFDKLKKKKRGTLVLWQDLDRLSAGEIDFAATFGTKIDRAREHISLVFHRYLSGEKGLKKVDIYINDLQVEPTDPFLSQRSTQIMDDETILVRGKKVVVRPFILPHLSNLSEAEIRMLGGNDGLRRKQGFYVYRNKRLLVWGTWFRLIRQGDLSKLARVQVDIPNSLDDLWTLDIKKSTATPPEEVRKNLANVVERISECSKRTWTFRGKKEVDDTKVTIWKRCKTRNGGYVYLINRDHTIVEAIVEKNGSLRSVLDVLFRQIENKLPLNHLYADMANDEKIENDTEMEESEVLKALINMIHICETTKQKKDFIERLVKIEPFCFYQELVQKYKEENL